MGPDPERGAVQGGDGSGARGGRGRRSLVAIIGVGTAVVVAITALLVSVEGLVDKAKSLASEVGLTKAYCDSVSLEVKTYDTVPYSLNYTIKRRHYQGRRDPYWFILEASNKCWWDDVSIEVEFQLTEGSDYAEINKPSLRVELPRRASKSVSYDPDFLFTGAAARAEDIAVYWKVVPRDDPDVILREGERKFVVLTRDTFPWGWVDSSQRPATWWVREEEPDRSAAGSKPPSFRLEPIPEEFILASLAAWTIDTHQRVFDLAGRLDRQVNLEFPDASGSRFVNRWLAAAYDALFSRSSSPRLFLRPRTVDFPRRRRIALPSQVLEPTDEGSRKVDALEAGLLLGAVVREMFDEHGSRFGLVFVPVSPEAPEAKRVLFVWWRDGSDARALDMGSVARPFEENAGAATATLRDLSAVLREMEADGVRYRTGDEVLGIDFLAAIVRHDIKRIR